MHIPKDLVAASSAPLVLSILAEGDNYGYAIIKRVHELSAGTVEWTDGMLYPLLHRLQKQNLITCEWVTPETGRKRKYYHLTAAGHEAIAEHKAQWQAVVETLHKAWAELGASLPVTPEPTVGGALA